MYSLILHGKRLVQLHNRHNLRVSVMLGQNSTTFSNLFSSASSAISADVSLRDVRKGKNFTVSYLVESLGLTTKLAESISMKVSLVDKGTPDSILSLLRTHGFTDPQISTIITTCPHMLIADGDMSLGPKLKFLQSRGASSSELTEIICTVPEILEKKGHKTLSVYFDFAKDMIKGDKSSNCGELCHSFPHGKKANKIRNILTLRELGVPQERLLALLISKSGPVYGTERFDEILKKLIDLRLDPTTKIFINALNVFYNIGNKRIEEKFQFYRSVGFTVDDVWEIFKKFPIFLELSEKKVANCIETFLDLGFSRDELVKMIKRFPACTGYCTDLVKKKIEFMVNEMKWPVEDVVSFPTVLGYSMENKIVPRCNVIKVLMLKGPVGKGGREFPSLAAMLSINDKAFLKRYVRKHNDKQLEFELLAIFNRDSEEKY